MTHAAFHHVSASRTGCTACRARCRCRRTRSCAAAAWRHCSMVLMYSPKQPCRTESITHLKRISICLEAVGVKQTRLAHSEHVHQVGEENRGDRILQEVGVVRLVFVAPAASAASTASFAVRLGFASRSGRREGTGGGLALLLLLLLLPLLPSILPCSPL